MSYFGPHKSGLLKDNISAKKMDIFLSEKEKRKDECL